MLIVQIAALKDLRGKGEITRLHDFKDSRGCLLVKVISAFSDSPFPAGALGTWFVGILIQIAFASRTLHSAFPFLGLHIAPQMMPSVSVLGTARSSCTSGSRNRGNLKTSNP